MKKIAYLTGILLIAAACRSGKEATSNSNDTKSQEKNVSELSSVNADYMSKSIKAQDDFFLFANEEWVKNNPVPASESRWGSFNELEQNNKEKLTKILDGFASGSSTKGSDAQLLGDYYASYMDMTERDKAGHSPIKKDLARISEMRSKSELVSILAQHHIRGISGFFNFGVGQDLKNVEKNISYLSQGGISLPNKEYYLSENKKDILTQYRIYINDLLQLYGYSEEAASLASKNILTLETSLAKLMYAPAEMRQPEKTYNKRSLKDTQKLFGKFDFEKYLLEIGSNSFDTLIVGNPEFVQHLGNT
ncbi:MAG: hypothetical protein ACK45H_03480, partial [Bacteroidota bacterium]